MFNRYIKKHEFLNKNSTKAQHLTLQPGVERGLGAAVLAHGSARGGRHGAPQHGTGGKVAQLPPVVLLGNTHFFYLGT